MHLLIEHQCPQCGAPATLEETERLFTCRYCRVKSYLLSQDFFRYLLPHRTPKGTELFYVPYWRFKGMHFASAMAGIKNRVVDASLLAVSSPHLPESLGFRSQTQKLRFVTPEIQGRFLKPDVEVKGFTAVIEEGFSASLPRPLFAQTLVGEALSQIFAPYAVLKGKPYDALLNRPLEPQPPLDFNLTAMPAGPPERGIRFIGAVCPQCGYILSGEKESLVLQCENCTSFVQAGDEGFAEIHVSHYPAEEEEGIFLPFYQIAAGVTGIKLDSYADLVRAANLPKVVRSEHDDMAFTFWSPAFKVRPADFLQLGRLLTLSQPQRKLSPRMPAARIHPVTLSVRDAARGLKLILASFIKPPDIMLPRLPEIEIGPKKALLVYIPFHERGSDLVQPSLKLRLTKTLLGFARNL